MECIMVLDKWRHRLYSYEETMRGLNFKDGVRGVKKLRGFVFNVSSMADRREDVGFSFVNGEEHVFLKKNARALGFVPDAHSQCGAYKKEDFLLEVTDQHGRKGYVLPENVRWSYLY